MTSNSFFVFLPSNVSDYPDNQPNKYRVRLPKPLHFSGSWVCGLHSISYPYSWHSTIGTLDDQWIDIHFTNLHSVDDDRQRVIRVPVPQASHKKVEQLRDFLQATLKSQEKVRLKPLAHEEGYFDKPVVLGSPPHAKRLKRSTIDDLSSLPSPPRYDETDEQQSQQQQPQSPPRFDETEKVDKKVKETTPPSAAKQPIPPAPTLAPPSHPPTEAPKAVTATKQAAPKSATAPPPKPSVTSTITAAKTTPPPAPIPPIKQAPSAPKPSPSKTAAVPKPTPTPTPASKSTIPTPASSTKAQNIPKIPPPLAAKPKEPNVAKKSTVPTTVSTTSISSLTSQIGPTPTTPKPPPPPIKPITTSIPAPSPPPPPQSIAKDAKRSVEAPNESKKESKRLDVDDRFFGGLAAGDEFPDDDDKESEWPYDPFKNIVDDVEIQYLDDFERFKVVFKNPVISHLSFSPQLGYVLGFENPQHVGPQEISKYGCDLRGGFSSFAVYSKGLTENMIVGNSLSSLLRVVSVSGATPGDYNEKIYDSPIYARVLPREISEIEIELRTMDKGRLVPFAYGTTMVVLIFKKVINF